MEERIDDIGEKKWGNKRKYIVVNNIIVGNISQTIHKCNMLTGVFEKLLVYRRKFLIEFLQSMKFCFTI